MIGPDRGQELVSRARSTLASVAAGEVEGPVRPPDEEGKYGTFVTLKRDDDLRGCCGYPEPRGPLPELVDAATVTAATSDPRFPAVSRDEVDALMLSVSILTDPQPLSVEPSDRPAAVTVGRHGLVLSRGDRRGLLLPQVATERGWSSEEFLTATARKADLKPTAWQEPTTTIETFTGRIFAEESPGGPVVTTRFDAGQPAVGVDDD